MLGLDAQVLRIIGVWPIGSAAFIGARALASLTA